MPIQAIDDARIARFTPPNLSADSRARLAYDLSDRMIDRDEHESAWNLVSLYKGSPQYEDALAYARTVQTLYVDQHMRGALAAGNSDNIAANLGLASPFDAAGSAAYRSGLMDDGGRGLMDSLSAMSAKEVATIVDRLSGVWGRANPDFSREKLALTMMKYKGHVPLNRAATDQLWSSLDQSPREQQAFGQWLRENASRPSGAPAT